jgi:hypothetical protein
VSPPTLAHEPPTALVVEFGTLRLAGFYIVVTVVMLIVSPSSPRAAAGRVGG